MDQYEFQFLTLEVQSPPNDMEVFYFLSNTWTDRHERTLVSHSPPKDVFFLHAENWRIILIWNLESGLPTISHLALRVTWDWISDDQKSLNWSQQFCRIDFSGSLKTYSETYIAKATVKDVQRAVVVCRLHVVYIVFHFQFDAVSFIIFTAFEFLISVLLGETL